MDIWDFLVILVIVWGFFRVYSVHVEVQRLIDDLDKSVKRVEEALNGEDN